MREVAPVKYLSTTDLIETDDLKYLCALVGLQGGDSHFREHFQQAVIDCFDIVFFQLIRFEIGLQFILSCFMSRMVDKSEVRIDGCGAKADQAGKMMHFPNVAGFHDDAYLSAIILCG